MKTKNRDLVNLIKADLEKEIDDNYKKNFLRFFKPCEKINFFGVPSPKVKKIISVYFPSVKKLKRKRIFSLCEELLKQKLCELNSIAFAFVFKVKKYEKNDFRIFERWIKKYVSNWGACDDLCLHGFGEFLFEFPEFLPKLKVWAKSKNRWFRRASSISLIYSLRRKAALKETFEMAEILFRDKDDLVQKGCGWTLKEASNVYPKEIFNFVMKKKQKMPRISLRYAIEKLPKDMKIKAIK